MGKVKKRRIDPRPIFGCGNSEPAGARFIAAGRFRVRAAGPCPIRDTSAVAGAEGKAEAGIRQLTPT